MSDVDLVVIGGGSGGVRAARYAAQLGAKVVLLEERDLGGTCVNRGCVPKKLFSYAAHTRHDLDIAKSFGFEVSGLKFNWETLRDNKDREIARLNGIYLKLLESHGVEVVMGRGVLEDDHTVRVGERKITTKNILIAVGGKPRAPYGLGAEHMITSDDIFHLEKFPKEALIIGGGYIGVEFASILQGLGVQTSLIIRGPKVLRGFDEEVRDHLQGELAKSGVTVLPHHVVTKLEERGDGGYVAHLGHIEVEDHHPHVIKADVNCDLILAAIGRAPYTAELGLEDAGVDVDSKGSIIVDEEFKTSADNVYAVGDVIDRIQLTPVALVEGMYVANKLFGKSGSDVKKVDYGLIPTAVFTSPEIGMVGLNEEEARKKVGASGKVRIYTSSFRPMKITLSDNQEKLFMKVIVNDSDDKLLGMHLVGPDAAEMVQGFAVAMRAGATKADLDNTIGIHPTAGEELLTMRTVDRVVDGRD